MSEKIRIRGKRESMGPVFGTHKKLSHESAGIVFGAGVSFLASDSALPALLQKTEEISKKKEKNPEKYLGIKSIELRYSQEERRMILVFMGQFDEKQAVQIWNAEFSSLRGIDRPSFRGKGKDSFLTIHDSTE